MMEKQTFNAVQIVSSLVASKHFGEIRRKAKAIPQFITANGTVDAVVLDYEQLYMRLKELEDNEETRILKTRIDRLDTDPSSAVSWKNIRRSGKNEGSKIIASGKSRFNTAEEMFEDLGI